ncbi:hypothetical protein HUA76_33575 [Myxococcus sp. CA056]|uniref:hypothetical protein n=1 Tax=Myxococcus sp. CA056 TaxID=2741740 RepID=UPI00157B0068|nr:hypothetical protein [Myxococcus sp. CA056]NTX15709.1 hypothetical protein [Myxococcus sp. CA056]
MAGGRTAELAVLASGTSWLLPTRDARTVRVLVGPTGMLSVLQDFARGVGGAAAGPGIAGDDLCFTGWQVDFDVTLDEGLAAYHQLLSAGALSDEVCEARGVSTATVRVAVGEARFVGSESWLGREASVFTTDERTGREDFQYTALLGNLILRSRGEVGDAHSHVHEVTLTGVAHQLVQALRRVHPRTATHDDTAVLVFTADEAERLRQGARDWMLAAEEGHPAGEDGTPEWVRGLASAESAEEAITRLCTSASDAARVAERVLELGALLLESEAAAQV